MGLVIYDDYGVHWDEQPNQYYNKYLGELLNIFFTDFEIPSKGHHIYNHLTEHGPIFEILMFIIQMSLKLSDSREIILLRHLCTFMVFYISAVFLALLLVKKNNDYITPSFGLLLYILHPRIFAHSFYNTTDISLLAFFTISLYTADNFFKDLNAKTIIFHAIASALAINVRLAGLIIPAVTTIILCTRFVISGGDFKFRDLLRVLAAYISLTMLLVLISNPIIFHNPGFLKESLNGTINHWPGSNPWYYTIYWFIKTTPIITSLLFLIGLVSLLWSFPTMKERLNQGNVHEYFCLLLVFFSIGLTIYFETRLYNSWRHLFFIYSSVVIICTTGFSRFIKHVGKKNSPRILVTILLFLAYLPSIFFIISYHPHQFIFGSFIMRGKESELMDQNSLDYWRVSCRDGFEYLLKTRNGTIKVGAIYPCRRNSDILSLDERERIVFSRDYDYYIVVSKLFSNSPLYTEVYSLNYSGEKYLRVFEFN